VKQFANDAIAQAPKSLEDPLDPASLGSLRIVDSALDRELNMAGGWFFSDESCSSILLVKDKSPVVVTMDKDSCEYYNRLDGDRANSADSGKTNTTDSAKANSAGSDMVPVVNGNGSE
jgi:hypothetical protein